MNLESIGENIRKQSGRLGLKQETLAEMVGISTSYMGSIERGEKLPSMGVFIRIANALAVSADMLLFGVPDVSHDILASGLSEQISALPKEDRLRILKAVQALVESYGQDIP